MSISPTETRPAEEIAEPKEGPPGLPQAPGRARWRLLLALLLVYIIWGSTYLAIRWAVRGIPPLTMAGVRFVLAGALLYLFQRARGVPNPKRPQWIGAFLVGTLLVGGNAGVTFAEQWVSSGVAALAVAAVPLWVALFSGFLGQWPNRREWTGVGIGFFGIGLLNLESHLRANPAGAAALLLGVLSWSWGSAWSRRLSLPPGLMASAAEMLTGGAVMLLLGFLRGERMHGLPDEQVILSLLYLIFFGSLLAFSAYDYLLRHARPALATSYAYANPVIAVALGAVLAGEKITPLGLVALCVILAGVGTIAWSRQSRRPT